MTSWRASFEEEVTRSLSSSMVTLTLSFRSRTSFEMRLASSGAMPSTTWPATRTVPPRGLLRRVPADGLEVDPPLHEPSVQHVDDLRGDELGRSRDRYGAVGLRERDGCPGALEVIALGEFPRGLLVGVVDLLHVDRGDHVEA
jgi:hypothetical protein